MSELSKKILNVQTELKAPKNQYNDFGKYKYRSAEDILEALKPLLVKNGLLLTISDEIELIGDRHYVKATVTVQGENSESVQVSAYAREPLSQKGFDTSQITGTASSYARKYALNGMFAIDDTKDSDTDEYRRQTNRHTEKAKSKPKEQASNLPKLTSEQIKSTTDAIKKMHGKHAELCLEELEKSFGVNSIIHIERNKNNLDKIKEFVTNWTP